MNIEFEDCYLLRPSIALNVGVRPNSFGAFQWKISYLIVLKLAYRKLDN